MLVARFLHKIPISINLSGMIGGWCYVHFKFLIILGGFALYLYNFPALSLAKYWTSCSNNWFHHGIGVWGSNNSVLQGLFCPYGAHVESIWRQCFYTPNFLPCIWYAVGSFMEIVPISRLKSWQLQDQPHSCQVNFLFWDFFLSNICICESLIRITFSSSIHAFVCLGAYYTRFIRLDSCVLFHYVAHLALLFQVMVPEAVAIVMAPTDTTRYAISRINNVLFTI